MIPAAAIANDTAPSAPWYFQMPYSEPYARASLVTETSPESIKIHLGALHGQTKLFVCVSDLTARDSLLNVVWRNATAACAPRGQIIERLSIEDASRRRVERLVNIQGALGVSMQLFAQMLGISRAQLYKWMDPTRDVELQQASVRRLGIVERLAKKWSVASAAPLSSVLDELTSTGKSLRETLTAPDLDEAQLDAALRSAEEAERAKPLTVSQRMRAAGFRSRRTPALPDDE